MAREGDTEQDSSIIQTRTRILFGDQKAGEICTEVTKFKAGSLKNFVDKWKHITEDDWILETISGYKIEFEQEPVQNCIPNTPNFNNTECALIDDEVEKMLSMGAIEKSQHEDNEFISNIFLVQKKNGKLRPVINLKKLN